MNSVASETKRAKKTIPVDELEARGLMSADDAQEHRKWIARAESPAGLLEDAQENAVTLRAHLNAAVVNLQTAQAWEDATSAGPDNVVLENLEERLTALDAFGPLASAGGAS